MILDKEVIIKRKNNCNLEYYNNLGYDTNSESFYIKVTDLLKNASVKVSVSCDYCGKIEKITYMKWNRSMESIIKKYACSNTCKGEKIKESNLIKYGVTSVAKLESSKEKSRKTCLDVYGFEVAAMSDVVKNKIKESNLEKWGVDCVLKNSDIRNRIKKTNMEIFGFDNPSKSDIIKEKKSNTTFKNWGVYIPLKSDILKEKVKEKNREKYGNEWFMRNEEWRKNNYNIANDIFYLSYISNNTSLFKCDCGEDHEFEISKDIYSKRKKYNINLCTVCNPIGENRSIKEKNLCEFIKSIYKGYIIQNWRDGRMEIDVYLPDKNIGFEFNGLYWHSDIYKEKEFHLNKKKYFEERGIRIINIWEDDWDNNNQLIKSQICSLLNLNTRIFARKCFVSEIKENSEVRNFLNENHIQGHVNSIIKLGLYNNGELVSIMTFDHFEGRKKMNDMEWNLSRFCSKKNYNLIGGASKLLSYFIRNYLVNRVISYADRDWSNGDLYQKLGFKLTNINKPDYKYIIGGKRVHKSRFRKSRTNINESQLDIPKIWDCGKLKFEINF